MSTETGVIEEARAEPGFKKQACQPTDRLTVLLVEDNPGDARLIQLMLEDAGSEHFAVQWVDRLDAGVRRLREGGIGLVLLDLSLPDSQGLGTFSQLHARAPQIPIIVLSGLNDTTVAVQAVHEGAQDYLVKGQVESQLLVRAMRYAIERKRMAEQLGRYAEELRKKNVQLESDLKMAREVQEIFLPHQFPSFPRRAPLEESALRFSSRYLPAAAVGGDFFDVFAVSDTTAGIFICDVMGHGMRAALVTAIMRGLVEELIPAAADPGKFVTEINRSLHAILRRTREPFLATAFYALADVAAGELRFSSAGHTSPLLVKRQSRTLQWLKSCDPRHGPALGLFEKPSYPTGHCPLARHDLLLLFTDGIYEVDNPAGEEFGQARLFEAVHKQVHLPRELLLDRLLHEVQRFSGSGEFDDDVCLVAAEVEQVGTQTNG